MLSSDSVFELIGPLSKSEVARGYFNTSTLLTLVLLPVIYEWIETRAERPLRLRTDSRGVLDDPSPLAASLTSVSLESPVTLLRAITDGDNL